jgi:phage terminase large subunit GpA-like protein
VPPPTTVSKWAEANIELTAMVTARPGPLDLDLTPYVREIMDAYGDDTIEEIAWVAGSQVSKSLFQQCCIAYTIAHSPAPALFVMPNEPDAKSFSKQRLQPLLLGCPEIAAQVDDPALITQLEMQFRECTITIVGSNSASRLSSRPIGRLFLDEVDKFAGATETEASALDLALNRTRTWPRPKHVFTSTPTLEDGDIWQEFLAGDQRYYYIPCPHCGEFDTLHWNQVKWPASCRNPDGSWDLKAIYNTAVYVCPHCSGRIDDDAKKAMLLRGEWRPTAEGAPRRRSYHLSGLYSTWATFGKLAVEFLKKKGDDEKLRDFVNSVLGEPWRVIVKSADADEILARREDYRPGFCPFEPLEVILSVDKQLKGYWYVVRAWGEREISALLEYGYCETDEDLLEIAATEYDSESGPKRVTCRVMDSGDYTDEVYEFCKTHGWQPLKGDGQDPQTFPSKMSPNPKCGRLLIVKTVYCKDAIERKMRIPTDRAGSWSLHEETGRDYADHLTAEKKYDSKDRYGKVTTKRKVVGPNHLLDCEVYNYAAASERRVRYRTLPSKTNPNVSGEPDRPFVRKPKHFKED